MTDLKPLIEETKVLLGAQEDESLFSAAQHVVRERDHAQALLEAKEEHLARALELKKAWEELDRKLVGMVHRVASAVGADSDDVSWLEALSLWTLSNSLTSTQQEEIRFLHSRLGSAPFPLPDEASSPKPPSDSSAPPPSVPYPRARAFPPHAYAIPGSATGLGTDVRVCQALVGAVEDVMNNPESHGVCARLTALASYRTTVLLTEILDRLPEPLTMRGDD